MQKNNFKKVKKISLHTPKTTHLGGCLSNPSAPTTYGDIKNTIFAKSEIPKLFIYNDLCASKNKPCYFAKNVLYYI